MTDWIDKLEAKTADSGRLYDQDAFNSIMADLRGIRLRWITAGFPLLGDEFQVLADTLQVKFDKMMSSVYQQPTQHKGNQDPNV